MHLCPGKVTLLSTKQLPSERVTVSSNRENPKKKTRAEQRKQGAKNKFFKARCAKTLKPSVRNTTLCNLSTYFSFLRK